MKRGGVYLFLLLILIIFFSLRPINAGISPPVYDSNNPDHISHAFDDWSTYSTASQIETTNRVDGGGSWQSYDPAFQSFSTSNPNPWFGSKSLVLDYQQPSCTTVGCGATQRGLALTRDTSQPGPDRYLNADAAKDSLVIEWAFKFTGTKFYEGKVADFLGNDGVGVQRYNYQAPSYDPLGLQVNTVCDTDPLCKIYYSNNGQTPRFSNMPPESGYFGEEIARSRPGLPNGNDVIFYKQNTGWPAHDWESNNNFVNGPWVRVIMQYTKSTNAAGSNGRIEQWVQKAGDPVPIKTMDYIVDAGQLAANAVYVQSTPWLADGVSLHWYGLSAQYDIFTGGVTISLGYIRIWSHSRETLGPDTTPPTATITAPTANQVFVSGTTQTTLSVTTSEAATCKWSTTNVAYGSMTNTFTTTGSTSHSTSLTGLTNGTNYTRYVRCQDTAGNAMTSSQSISFSIGLPPVCGDSICNGGETFATCPADCPFDTTPPTATITAPTANQVFVSGTTQTTLSVTTSEAATCKWSTTNVAYGSMTNTFTTTGSISHSTTLTGLSNGGSYTRYVRCQDTAGNAMVASQSVSFSVASAGGAIITIGETNILPADDSGNGNLLLAQSATLSQSATIQSLSFYVTAVAGNLRLGIYDSTGPSGGPGTKVAETSEFTPTVGWNTANVLTPVILSPGTYWLAYLPQSSSLSFRVDASSGSLLYYSYTYAPMPATFSTSPTSSTGHWSLYATLMTPSSDTTPPTIAITAPTAGQQFPIGTTSTTLSVTTNEAATCKYSSSNDIYDNMANTFTATGSASHNTTLTGLSDGQAYTFYVRCQDTAGNKNNASSSVSFSVNTFMPICGDNVCNNNEDCSTCSTDCGVCALPTCDLTSASWSTTNASEGNIVYLNVFGTNCSGETISFEVWERDLAGLGDDPVNITPQDVVFNGDSASGTWVAEWQNDGLLGFAGDPEYYFTASVTESNENVQSSTNDADLLHVNHTVSCGDGFIEGSEQCDDGSSNGLVCTPSYGSSCNYCSLQCQTATVQGAFCGDGVCNGPETSGSCSADCLPQTATILFQDSFESGALGDSGRWQDIVNAGASIVTASGEGITAVNGTKVMKIANPGVAISHFVATSNSPYKRLYLKYNLYRTSAYEANNPGLRAGGIRGSTTQWGSFGVGCGTGSICPDTGSEEFMFAYNFNHNNWQERLYTQWLGQTKLQTNPAECCGNYAQTGNPAAIYYDLTFVPTVNVWHQYEIEVILNDLGQANGATRVWVDGVLKIEHANVIYQTDDLMRLWAITFDSGSISGNGAYYVDGLEVWTSRPSPDTTAPSQPTNLQAIANSSSQINLTWTASTDDFGIAGYQIFRCLGTCTPTVNIANTTGTGTNYSSTGLTASTTYTYRVAARDAAGNMGSQSASANATTQVSGESSALEFPVFETMPGAVLHVFEDWSTYSTPSQIASTNRVDGGGPWRQDDGVPYQTFSTTNNDPWFGTKTLNIDFQDAPTVVHQRGLVLTRDDALSPPRYLNAAVAKDSLVIEWAVRQSGTAFYSGKIADWQPTGATNRYNFQNSYDPMGQQRGSYTPAGCAADNLCARYYLSNGDPRTIPDRPAIPELGVFGYQFARAYSGSMGTCSDNCVFFYPQNINWGTGAGQYQSLQTSPLVGTPDNTWERITFQLTRPAAGQSFGQGRIEAWVTKAGGNPVKFMDYIGDLGQLDQNYIYVGPSDQAWLPDGATLHFYDLTAVLGNFDGGNTLHLGYFRMWSHSREALGPDITPPTATITAPTANQILTAGTTQTTLSVTTNEAATCKWSTTNVAYGSMTNTFTTTGSTSHSTTLTGLANGGSYTRYVRCQDTAGNTMTSSVSRTFSVAAADTTPPTATITAPTANQIFAAGTTQTTLSVTTSEAASCKYNDVDAAYSSMLYTLIDADATSHTITITNLQNGTGYTKYVRCQDTAGNAMTSSQTVSFSVASPIPVCGDGLCNFGETSTTCPIDCPTSFCGDGVCNASETSATCPADCPVVCDLTSATWSTITATEADTVYLQLTGNNCNLKTISFEIKEYDVVGDDAVQVNPLNVIFTGNSVSGSWRAEWQIEGLGESDPPEYYFTASVVGALEQITSGKTGITLLSVTRTNTCGDGIIAGGEQCDDGNNNGQVCTPSYGGVCGYCSSQCQTVVVQGASCGDGICNGPENSTSCLTDCPVIDNTPPTATITAPTANQVFAAGTTQTTLSVTTNEAASCKWSTSNQAYGSMPNTMTGTGTSHSTTLTGLSNGQAYIRYVRCNDTAGNAMTSSSSVSFSVAAADTTPPTATITSPIDNHIFSAGTTQITLMVTTNEAATCKWSTSSQTYSSMPNTFTTTGGTSHSTSLTGLTNGTNYTRYVRCQDIFGNSMTSSQSIRFSVASPTQTISCGDGICNGNETTASCPADCPSNLPKITITYNWSEWSVGTTNLSEYNSAELQNISGVAFVNQYGKIQFTNNINISRDIDLIGKIKISDNKIYIDSSSLPEFNRSAELTLQNINMANPIIKRDGFDCSSNICKSQSYNTNTKTFTFTVTQFSTYTISEQCSDNIQNYGETGIDCGGVCAACSTSGNTGGGGGGGGGSSGESPSVKDTKNSGETGMNEPIIFTNFAPETGIRQILVNTKNYVKNARITISQFDTKPTGLARAKEGKVYKYLQIETEDLLGNVERASVDFQVDQPWVLTNNLAKNEMALFKYLPDEDRWVQMETTYTSADNAFYYYTSNLNSFSYFAIAEADTPIGEASAAGTTTPTNTKTFVIIILVLILLIVLVLIAIIVRRKKSVLSSRQISEKVKAEYSTRI